MLYHRPWTDISPLTNGPDYIRFFTTYLYDNTCIRKITSQILNMLK